MELYIFIGVFTAVLLYAAFVKPLLLDEQTEYFSPPSSHSDQNLSDDEQEILKIIADLELDFNAGKISEEEYHSQLAECKSKLI